MREWCRLRWSPHPLPWVSSTETSVRLFRTELQSVLHTVLEEIRVSKQKPRLPWLAWLRDAGTAVDFSGSALPLHVGPVSVETLYVPLDVTTNRYEAPTAIFDYVDRHSHVLVQGEPGSGKTTVLRYLAARKAGEHLSRGPREPLPLLVDLPRMFSDEAPRSLEALAALLGREAAKPGCPWLPPEPSWEALLLGEGRCMLLLDGLDEVRFPIPSLHGLIEDAIRRRHRLVLAGRPGLLREPLPAGLQTVNLAPLTLETAGELINRWAPILQVGVGEYRRRLRAYIPSDRPGEATSWSPQTVEILQNPLLLTCVCLVAFNQRGVPRGRTAAYKAAYRWMMNSLDSGPSGHRDRHLAELLVQDLGLDWLRAERGEVRPLERRLAILTEVDRPADGTQQAEEIERVADQIRRSRILDERGEGGSPVLRQHEFLPFCAAQALEETDPDDERHGWRHLLRNDPDWFLVPRRRESLRFLAGLLARRRDWRGPVLVRELLGAWERAVGTDRHLRFAALILGVRREMQDAGRYLSAALEQAIDEVKADGLGVLEEPGESTWAARQDFAEALGEDDARLRDLAAHLLPVAGAPGVLLDRFLLTVRDYRPFVEAGGYEDRDVWTAEGYEVRSNGGRGRKEKKREAGRGRGPWWTPLHWEHQLRYPNRPVVGISWYEAQAWCAWKNRQSGSEYRLPMAWEREAAALRPGDAPYPWPRPGLTDEDANWGGTLANGPTPVGIFPAGRGAGGHLDLAGNVWEWCDDHTAGTRADPIAELRGGSWANSHPQWLETASRFWGWTDYRAPYVGFRVAVGPIARPPEGLRADLEARAAPRVAGIDLAPAPGTEARLLVGGLSRETRDRDLRAFAERFLGEAGVKVLAATVSMDPDTDRSRGYGMLHLAGELDAKTVAAALDRRDLHGRAVRVCCREER
jgi:formylglycine-generating enzyme required for sulfatase activity